MNSVIVGFVPVIIMMATLAILYIPLDNYMEQVFTIDKHLSIERDFCRAIGVHPEANQCQTRYTAGVFSFSTVGVIFVYLLQRVQQWLPLNHGKGPVSPDQAWNTAMSFITNTNWQSYSGEGVMTVLTQMTGLVVQNFISAAVGIAVVVVLIRGLADRHGDGSIGSFWIDLTCTVLRVLLPIAATDAVPLISQGAIRNFSALQTIQTVTDGSQTIPGGAVVSQEVIKELDTNDGGYFNASSAHPFENPNAWVNMLEIFPILSILASLTKASGVIIGDKRQDWAILPAIAVLYFISLAIVVFNETVLQVFQDGGIEDKEMRFGVLPSSFFTVATTMTSVGTVDSFHPSHSPLAGDMLILNMLPGEISPGGVGFGLYGMLIIAILTAFTADLMVDRTPEHLGKRIGVSEITKVCLYILIMPVLVLAGIGISTMSSPALDSVSTEGPRGFLDLIYAFTSAPDNNGSTFAGFGADAPRFNMNLGFTMLFGRFLPVITVLGLAGDFARQQPTTETAGTLPTHRPQFVGLTVAIAITVSALTSLPTLVLGSLTGALS